MQKAAIVIGVNKTGDLPVLNAAVAGAAQVADWLRGEGFQVKRYLDIPDAPSLPATFTGRSTSWWTREPWSSS